MLLYKPLLYNGTTLRRRWPASMPKCFVIMPISTAIDLKADYGDDPDHFKHVLDYLFKPALEYAKYDMIPPSVLNSQVIQAEIIHNLEVADLVLCDISQGNANVFFELGIRVALDRPVALVKDSKTSVIPFDNALVNCHTYDARIVPWRLEAEIKKLAQFVQSAGTQERNALWKYFGITQRANAPKPGDPVQGKLDLILASLQQRPAPGQTLGSRLQGIFPGLGLAHIPEVVSITAGPPMTVDIRILPGQTPDDFAAYSPSIAYQLGVAEIRVITLDEPSLIRLELLGETR